MLSVTLVMVLDMETLERNPDRSYRQTSPLQKLQFVRVARRLNFYL